MKTLLITLFLPAALTLSAQQPAETQPKPALHAAVFSESIGLPGFSHAFIPKQAGLRLGMEWYYRNTPRKQVVQQVNLSGYQHPGYHNALVLNTAISYRPYLGAVFFDLGGGLGYMLVHSRLPLFENTGPGQFSPTGSVQHKASIHLSAGLGYRFRTRLSVFTAYEVLAEVPFGFAGSPVLPHRLICLGMRMSL